jgi:hypothetical protein
MKRFTLALVLFLAVGVSSASAATNGQRTQTTITDETAVASPVPVAASLAPVITTTDTTDLTKGGQPVSGNIEMTLLMMVMGLGLASFGAYKALKVK